MTCQRCKSERVAHVSAKCSDLFNMDIGEKEYEGYVPGDVVFGLGCHGDYVRFNICLDCGQMQGHWPNPAMGVETGEEE